MLLAYNVLPLGGLRGSGKKNSVLESNKVQKIQKRNWTAEIGAKTPKWLGMRVSVKELE